MTRVLRMTMLAPDIVAEILDGDQRPKTELARLLEVSTVVRAEQHAHIG
jgi:hypothetical protein